MYNMGTMSYYNDKRRHLGVAIAFALLLLTQSTFTIWGLVKVSIPGIGTIEPSDFFMLYMVAKHYFADRKECPYDPLDHVSIMMGLWMCISFFANFMFDEIRFPLFFTSPARLALLWLCFPALRRLDIESTKVLLFAMLLIVVMVMVAHIYVQILDVRELMPLMYYSVDIENPVQAYQIEHSDYFRVTPSGQLLSGAVFTSCFMALALFRARRNKVLMSLIMLLVGCGLLVNITRSVLLAIVFICPVLVIMNLPVITPKRIKQICFFYSTLLLAFLCVTSVRPDLKDRFLERFETSYYFGGDSSNPRLLDNLAAVSEIVERPVVGNGFPKLREYITDIGGDVNSYIMVCLHGGVPLLLLFLSFIVCVWKYRYFCNDICQPLAQAGFLYILIMWGVVAPGANGPHAMRELAPFLVFSAILSRKVMGPDCQAQSRIALG